MHAFDLHSILDDLGEMDFAQISSFNDGHVGAFWSGPPAEPESSATSPWELHPDTDELLLCVDGTVEIQILATERGPSFDDDLTRIPLTAGQFAVVPRGHWHRHHATAAFRELYLTPGHSDHSHDEDPRPA